MTYANIRTALRVLADAHTQDDHVTGFNVQRLASSQHVSSDYIEAWKTVRQYLGLPTEPALIDDNDHRKAKWEQDR